MTETIHALIVAISIVVSIALFCAGMSFDSWTKVEVERAKHECPK